uniref:Uncharacterized protein n=1 Tax=Fagus sylvatica TaxID=28930 RepID=A0A2N9GTB7_FAGSY
MISTSTVELPHLCSLDDDNGNDGATTTEHWTMRGLCLLLLWNKRSSSKAATANRRFEIGVVVAASTLSFPMDYLKTVVPSQLIAERGPNLVVINPGSANIRIGLATHDTPFNVPHCIARYTSQVPKRNVQDQMLNSQITTAQHMEREKAYDIVSLCTLL